jgi:hypothetical protein
MPAPNVTGRAVLQPINLTSPAFLGLNTDAGAQILPPEWATVANNAVFDENNRLSARKGWSDQTTTSVAGVIMRVHEYIKADGTAEIISSTDADIFSGVTAPSSIEGSLGISEGNIKFVNFNDKCIALGTGTSSNPSVYTGSGNFTTVTVNSGTAPTSGIGTAAYGRLWVVDSDGKTIRYSALLDETRWAVADGGGTIDMSKVWVSGQDQVIAIAEFSGELVIFGKNQIIIWSDASASTLGIDPDSLYIADTITGLGAVSQFGITQVEGDLWFMAPSGVHSLLRARTERNSPTQPVTENVTDEYQAFLMGETDEDDVTLVYSPEEDFAIVCFPSTNRQIVVHGRAVRGQSGAVYRNTTWTSDLQTAYYRVSDRTLLGALTGVAGELFKHDTYADNGSSYSFGYESGWLDLGIEAAQFMKWVKKLTAVVFVASNTTVNYSLKYDFNTNARVNQAVAVGSIGSEFNVSEFTDSGSGIGYKDPTDITLGESEFSGGITLRTMPIPASGGGQYIKVGVSMDTQDAAFALQQINIFAKVGRIANV